MSSVVLILHLLVAVGLVCLVLMQRSEGGALGMGGGSGSLISGRGAADVLVRSTAILAAIFFVTSISLTLLAGGAKSKISILDTPQRPSIFDTLFPKKAPPPVPMPSAPATTTTPISAPSNADIIPPPADAMQHAGPLEGPSVATLPPISAAPAAALPVAPPMTSAKPAALPKLAEVAPKPVVSSAAKPVVSAAPASAKPPVSAAAAKPPVRPAKATTGAAGESGQPAPPPSRAGPDE